MQNFDTRFFKPRRMLLSLGAVGLVAFVVTLIHSPQRAWANLLLGNYYFVSLSAYGALFVAFVFVFNGGWTANFRRVPEAMSAFLPLGALVMLALFFGRSQLYEWTRPEVVASHPQLQHKAAYLNVPFFYLRTLLAFGVWIFFSRLIRRHSQQQDLDGDLVHTRKNQTCSAAFVVLFAITFIFVSFDWLMSLEPEWASTMFPLYNFAGLFLGGTAAMIVLVIWLKEWGLLTGVTDHHLHELARALCASSLFWAYIWFCQYMLIYYTNIPEESVYYVRRLTGFGPGLVVANLMLNWLLPHIALISAQSRRSPQTLLKVCAVVLIGRWLDLYLIIMPALAKSPSGGASYSFGLPDILIPLGFLPLFLLPFLATFRKASPVPEHDPFLAESVHYRV